MSVNVADLVATLRADVGNFVSGFKSADAAQAALAKTGGVLDTVLARVGFQGVAVGRILTSLNSPLVASGAAFTAVAAAVGLSLEKYRQMGIEARRLSAVSGLTVTDADDLADKFALLGLNAGALDVALLRLSADIDNGGAQLEKLGINIRNTSGALKEPGNLLLEVREKIAGITDAATQNAAGMQLFGRGFKELSPAFRATAEEWERLGERANALQPPWTDEDQRAAMEMNRRVNELKLSVEGLYMVISRSAGPMVVGAGAAVAGVVSDKLSQLQALAQHSEGPGEAIIAMLTDLAADVVLGGTTDRRVARSTSRLYTPAENAKAQDRRLNAARVNAPTDPESAMVRAQEDLVRAEAAIANGAGRSAAGVGKLSVQRLELGAMGSFDAKKQQIDRETELVERATALQTITEAEAADKRLALIAREREAVEELFAERLRILRASSDYEINAELTMQNAKATALAQATAQEESARTARLRAVREEELEAGQRAARLIQAEHGIAEVAEQVHQQRLRNLGQGAAADRATTEAQIANARRAAESELRNLDLELKQKAKTVELEKWAADQRQTIRETEARKVELALQQEVARRRQVFQESYEMVRDGAFERGQLLDDVVAATYQAEGRMYDAARASAAAQTNAAGNEYAKRLDDLNKMLREGQRTAESVEQARVQAAAKASAEIIRAQMGLYGAQRQAIAAGAGVGGAPSALEGLAKIQKVRDEITTMQQSLRVAGDTGELTYREVVQAGEEFTERTIARLEAMTPAFANVPSVVDRKVRELVGQLRQRGGLQGVADTSPMGEFRSQLDALRGTGSAVAKIGEAAGLAADGGMARFEDRLTAVAAKAGALTGVLQGLEGALKSGTGAVKAADVPAASKAAVPAATQYQTPTGVGYKLADTVPLFPDFIPSDSPEAVQDF